MYSIAFLAPSNRVLITVEHSWVSTERRHDSYCRRERLQFIKNFRQQGSDTNNQRTVRSCSTNSPAQAAQLFVRHEESIGVVRPELLHAVHHLDMHVFKSQAVKKFEGVPEKFGVFNMQHKTAQYR